MMKTTVEINDKLFREIKAYSVEHGITMKEIFQLALKGFLEKKTDKSKTGFKLKDGSVGGGGLVDGLSETDWPKIRDIIYEGHGS